MAAAAAAARVCVVGAGPAGIIATAALSQAGHRVTWVDTHRAFGECGRLGKFHNVHANTKVIFRPSLLALRPCLLCSAVHHSRVVSLSRASEMAGGWGGERESERERLAVYTDLPSEHVAQLLISCMSYPCRISAGLTAGLTALALN